MTGWRKGLAGGASILLLLGLAACAPEPDVEWESDGEPNWQEENPDEVHELVTELPASFPEGFVVPEDATVYNTGEREDGTWFLVLSADSADEADTLWSSVISESGFTVSNEETTPEGGVSALLTSDTLEAQALTIPQDDGSEHLNYDISAY